MDNETRDYLEDHFKTIYERQDSLKDTFNDVRLHLTSKITKQEEQISQHEKDIGLIQSRSWQLLAGIVASAVSLAWQGLNSLLGGRH
jgi:hypothetical protein